MNTNLKKIVETTFIIFYLLFLMFSSIILTIRKSYYILIMVLILGIGDSFHLIPRIVKNIKGDFKNSDFYLGLGTQISSITMTLFYLLLIFFLEIYSINGTSSYITNSIIGINRIFRDMFSYVFKNISLGNIVIYLSVIRIVLCLLPQNNWYKKEGNNKWSIIRNIPFLILDIISLLFALENSFTYLGILIALSFIFYLPVVLFGKKHKKVGMLMIPKTICYILMVLYLLKF